MNKAPVSFIYRNKTVTINWKMCGRFSTSYLQFVMCFSLMCKRILLRDETEIQNMKNILNKRYLVEINFALYYFLLYFGLLLHIV